MSTVASDLAVGHVLDGRYRVVGRLAHGGMGAVYVALDTRLDRTVALKVMHPALAEDENFVRRFIGEAKSAARLSHPNVVGVYDQGRDSGYVFLVMEYVPGRTLRDLLQERGRLDPHEALPIMESVLAALAAAHRSGLIHRDVKPENVLLADDGRVKVADFGLARAITSSNHTKTSGLVLGTVAYLSPEQVEHGSADPRSDVYAAGIMLFELLTGRQPFGGETPLAVAYKHVNESVPFPSRLVPGLPQALDAMVVRATDRDRARRPADANELLGATLQVHHALPPASALLADPESNDEGPPGPRWTGPGATDAELATEVIRRDSHATLMVPQAAPPTGATSLPPGPPTRPSRRGPWDGRRTVLASALAIAALLGVGVLAFALLVMEVPKGLAGVTVQAAKSKAEGSGFHVEVGPARFSEDVPRDHVIVTEPRGGTMIRRGGTITLVPSKGPPVVEVPDLRGMSLGEAKKQLRATGLRAGQVSHDYSTTVPKGEVIRTKPDAGERIRHGSNVDLVVSRGIQVPDLRGLLLQQAEEELHKRGFDIDITERFSQRFPKGRVIAQSPSRGGAEKGSMVELIVSKGPPLVAVPDVVGMKVNEAKKQLEEASFKASVHRIFGNTVRAQWPRAGSRVPKGSTVTILASS